MIDPALVLDEAARLRLVSRFGDGVLGWCDRLPVLVDELAARWGLTVYAAVPGGTARTLRARGRDGRELVLTVTPDPVIAREEAAALRLWSSLPRVVDLVDADVAVGALLLDGLVPGTPLSGAESVPWSEVGEILLGLSEVRPPEGIFPELSVRVAWIFGLYRRRLADSVAAERIPGEWLSRSAERAARLADGGARALVHGDLHPGNVLDAGPGRGAVVIDPRPCIGDPTSDAADWVFLRMRAGESVESAVSWLVALAPGLDGDRVLDWCRAYAVLAAVSELRSGGPAEYVDRLLALVP